MKQSVSLFENELDTGCMMLRFRINSYEYTQHKNKWVISVSSQFIYLCLLKRTYLLNSIVSSGGGLLLLYSDEIEILNCTSFRAMCSILL